MCHDTTQSCSASGRGSRNRTGSGRRRLLRRVYLAYTAQLLCQGPRRLLGPARRPVHQNCDFYEYVLQGASVRRFGVLEKLEVDNEGHVHGPKGPGLGVTMDWELLNKLTLETLS